MGTQSAALFVLLAIIVSGLLAMIAVAQRGADQTQLELDALWDLQISASRVDSAAQSLIGEIYLWNNSLVAEDSQGAQQTKKQIADDSSTITSLVAGISALR